jgi:hybrid cluster-associated redox disulfide protein
MAAAALIVAVIALVLAIIGWSRANAVTGDLARTREDLHQARMDLASLRDALQAKIDDLGREARRSAGQLKFVPTMTIADAMQVDPGVAQVLADFHLGGCSNCAVSDVDTLEGACRSYGIDLESLMVALNRLLSQPARMDSDKPIKIGSGGMRVEL